MQGYELTERGKIAIAIILAIFLIVLAVILAIRVWNGSSSPFDNQNRTSEQEQAYTPPEISSTPSPEGNGTPPEDAPENGEQGSFDPPQEPADEPSEDTVQDPSEETTDSTELDEEEPPQEEGQSALPVVAGPSLNRSAGTMSFRFSPSSQDSLDEDTIAMLGDFLDSPANTANSRVVVSIPRLPETETAKIIAAVTDAFAEQGVEQRDLAFTVYSSNSGNASYEIRLSFSQSVNRK